MKKVIFIDLDDTLIEPISGETFPKGIWDMCIKFDVWEGLKKFVKENGTEFIFIVTNQGGIESGYINKSYFFQKLQYIKYALQDFLGVEVLAEYCDTNDKKDLRRKPNTEMLRHCLANGNGWNNLKDISKSEILMIGDASGKPGDFSDTDKKTAENFGIDYLDVNEFVKKYYSE